MLIILIKLTLIGNTFFGGKKTINFDRKLIKWNVLIRICFIIIKSLVMFVILIMLYKTMK